MWKTFLEEDRDFMFLDSERETIFSINVIFIHFFRTFAEKSIVYLYKMTKVEVERY